MKKIILIVVGLIIILTGISIVIGNYFYNLAINPSKSKNMVFSDKKDSSVEPLQEETNWILDEIQHEDKYITSEDGLKLHGCEIRNDKSDKWVITVHGYMGNGSEMESYAKEFFNRGYNVLVPDLRGHGESEGDYIAMGWNDHFDVKKWIDYIIEREEDSKIILHGISMGAATVMMTAGEDLPSNVKAIIEDCGYTSVKDEFGYQLKRLFNLPEWPILEVASLVTKIRSGYWFGEASSIEQLKKAKIPILFIHGSEDDFVPFCMLDEVYNSANTEKQKLIIEGAGHVRSESTDSELYWRTVFEFINRYV